MPQNKIFNLLFISISHALTDLVCAYLLFSIFVLNQIPSDQFFYLVIWYGLLAFGLQPLFGLVVDFYCKPYLALSISLVLLFIAIYLNFLSPWLTITLCALGNALFHVAGGTISFNITPRRATAPGIFVGPGALGLFFGTYLGKTHPDKLNLILIGILLVFLVLIKFLPPIKIDYQIKKIPQNKFFWWILFGLLLVVGMRSIVGMSLVYAWKSDLTLAFWLVFFIVIGKMIAGIIADKFGWLKMSILGLLLSIPLIYFGASIPSLAYLGVLFDQITMPVTLTAVALLWPGRPGWAFGLPCAALILGALITFFDFDKTITSFIPIISLLQLIIVYYSLTYFYKLKLKT